MACPTGKICVNSPDPRINYNLMPGEVLMTCPYNVSHAVLPIKFAKHVLNCHRLHCKDQKAKDEQPLFSICQYDRSHHVRNAELAFHEAQCKIDIEKGNDWGDDDLPGPPRVDFEVAPLQPPPEIDEASMRAIRAETWESEENFVQFDHRKRIEQLRLEGYNVVNTLDHIGLTKSEKKEFYKQDSKDMRTCAQISFLNRMKKETSGTGGSTSGSGSSNPQPAPSSAPSCASAYGFGQTDDSLGSIEEDEDEEWY